MAYFKPYEPKRRFKQKRDQRGAHYSSKKTGWRRKRLWFIRRHPLCAHCLSERGLRVKAIDVDHIVLRRSPGRFPGGLVWHVAPGGVPFSPFSAVGCYQLVDRFRVGGARGNPAPDR